MTPLVEAIGLAMPGRLEESALALGPGTLTALVGPNGSGKTSLLRALAGVGGAAGAVRIAGVDPAGQPPAARAALLSLLPAAREAHWPVSGRDLIALGLPAGGEGAIDEALALLDLAALQRRAVDRLSTGERTRFLIARALAARPRLLLLDEPIANLDPHWQLRLLELVREEVRGRERAALVALHDLDLAARFADRMIVMDGGRIAIDGAPDEVLGGDALARIFGIRRVGGAWKVSLDAGARGMVDPRTSPG